MNRRQEERNRACTNPRSANRGTKQKQKLLTDYALQGRGNPEGVTSEKNKRSAVKRTTIILTLALCLATSGRAYAQRYLPGQTGIEVSGGLVDGFRFRTKNGDKFYATLTFSTYNKKGNRWVGGVEYLQHGFAYRGTSFPVSQFTAEGGHYVKFFSDRSKTVFLSAGASALLGYETLNWNRRELYDGARITDKDGFIGGAAVTFEVETFITDRIVFLVRARERALFGGASKIFRFQLGAGFKFIIN